MKKLIGIFLLIISFYCYSQDRVNAPIPQLSNEILGNVSSVTGWSLSPEGQWVSRPNRIPRILESQFSALQDVEKFKMGIDNFVYYQFRKIKLNEKEYLILIKKEILGEYRYPAIEKEWIDQNHLDYYVFNLQDITTIQNKIKDGQINYIQIHPVSAGGVTNITNQDDITAIQNELAKDDFFKTGKSHFGNSLAIAFHIAPYKAKDIVQFNIYPLYIPASKSRAPTALIVYGNSEEFNKVIAKDELFKLCYYETDYKTFNNFLHLDK